MRIGFYHLALLAAAVCLAAGAVQAHPQVWVTMTEELLYAPDGSVTGVRHTWTFDDMFSAFAVQGLDQETNGTFTRGSSRRSPRSTSSHSRNMAISLTPR